MGSVFNNDRIQSEVSALCAHYPEVIAAFLFGSYAKDKATERSDLDIALLLDNKKEDKFKYLDFKVALEKTFDRDADLIILNRAGAILKHQVRKYGRLLYDADPPKRKEWEIKSRKFYQDFLRLHRIYMQKTHNHFEVKNGR